jgi:phosphoribosylglycinamide formyltransferase-1
MSQNMTHPLRLVVLLSGNGSNLQAIIDSIKNDALPAQIVAVISNKADAYGLVRASNAGIPHEFLSHADFSDRVSFDQALQQRIDHYQPDLVILAGFMRILSDEFVEHYTGRMLNIHPSLLPAYKGLNTHQRVIDAGEKEHGCSVHFVTPALDDGPVILQAKVPVKENDSAETLAERVHTEEHRIYPEAIRLFAENKLSLNNPKKNN